MRWAAPLIEPDSTTATKAAIDSSFSIVRFTRTLGQACDGYSGSAASLHNRQSPDIKAVSANFEEMQHASLSDVGSVHFDGIARMGCNPAVPAGLLHANGRDQRNESLCPDRRYRARHSDATWLRRHR